MRVGNRAGAESGRVPLHHIGTFKVMRGGGGGEEEEEERRRRGG